MGEDIHLMFENARTYNQDGSELYNDAIIMESVWTQVGIFLKWIYYFSPKSSAFISEWLFF